MNKLNRIVISELNKSYGDQKIFEKFNLTVDNSFVAIQGSSGSGKSTLLRIIGGLDSLYTGSVMLDNVDLKSRKINLDIIRAKKVGFVFQFHYLLHNLTIKENILLPTKLLSLKESVAVDKTFSNLISILDIEKILDKTPLNCSGGERQRAAVARAMMNNPSIILADEPTGNLDNENSLKVAKLLQDINKFFGTTVLVATHDDKVASYADRVFLLNK
jgi:lipoprotein-releasing system ATP-binding protein